MAVDKIIVLVGLMGAGKSRVGQELAKLLGIPFVDSDREIEKAAGMKVAEIFERFGEKYFREGEKKVMLRLLSGEAKVLASGGGGFIQPEIRKAIKEKALSVWLKADIETLLERVSRSDHRPLLQGGDRADKMKALMEARYPVYAEADVTVVTDHQSPLQMARKIGKEIENRARA